MYGFTFNGVDSMTYGVVVENPPEIPVGQLRSETQSIIGSSKVLHYTEGPYVLEPLTVSLDCALVRPGDQAIRDVCAWLIGGGDLITPAQPDRSLRAWVKNQISLESVIRQRKDRRFTVEFECEPFRYHYPAAAAFAFNTQGRLQNPGTAPAEPLIRLNGSGDVSLLIDGTSLLIDGVSSYVMIDCETQMVYKGNSNLGASVTRIGDWPVIAPGGSLINWTGNVTGLQITPRWRDL